MFDGFYDVRCDIYDDRYLYIYLFSGMIYFRNLF